MKNTIKTSEGYVFVDSASKTVSLAGDKTTDGAPVDVKTFKVSSSVANANANAALRNDYNLHLSKHTYNGSVFYMLKNQ